MNTSNINNYLQELSIFRIGEIYSVDGRNIRIKVDTDKNLSYLIYKGNLIKNVSVGSYLKILKGFNVIVCQVESEYIKETDYSNHIYHNKSEEFSRFLNVKLIGFFIGKKYYKGIKEMPLIGNECLLMNNEDFLAIHKFTENNEMSIEIGHLINDDTIPIQLGINKLFANHIGIFGNTGSGKSYTLATLYKKLFDKVENFNNFKSNAKFLLFDFNGEYSGNNVITSNKTTYKISTKDNTGNKIPLKQDDLLNPELINILANATEKTQQPFIKRTLRLYERIHGQHNWNDYLKKILRELVEKTVCMTDIIKSKLIIDYFEQILPHDQSLGLTHDLSWHGKYSCYYTQDAFFNNKSDYEKIKNLALYKAIDEFEEPNNFIETIITYLYIQLIADLLNNRAQNEHISPAINKLKSLKNEFDKVFLIDNEKDFWNDKFFVVIDVNNANINIKKLVPLLMSYKLYNEHKKNKSHKTNSSLNIIIDEAHNILSYESLRESESWKDFRLETFEEIIKEGRKFSVFLTIASQRPSDISPTIISQLHNYLIHRLVNNRDLEMIEKTISFLDKLSHETLPILPIGACVLSGLIVDLPIIIQVNKLTKDVQPQSETISLESIWSD